MNAQKDLERIIQRYVSGKATPDEVTFVEKYYQYLDKGVDILDKASEVEEEDLQLLLAAIHRPVNRPKHIILKYAVAAAILVMLGVGILFISKDRSIKGTPIVEISAKPLDILPGKNKAVLTLANGSKVILNDLKGGKISETADLVILKTKSGQLIYQANALAKKANVIAYNKIETPKGGQYQVVLPDGTKVWLNASSSLIYPEQFISGPRKVTLTGEAYFEVAKDKARPFIVRTDIVNGRQAKQEVEVLGTHFNVNGYGDEQTIKTTLTEGSVKVSYLDMQTSKVIAPGQQSVIGANAFLVNNVETADETAWKDGLFRFNNSNLKNILYQLERWYDVKIDYTNIPNKRYNGMVPRKAQLSEVLKMLELTGNIKFKIEEGRELKVLTK